MSAKDEVRVRIPQLKSIETAIWLYYERFELTNSDIRELFGNISSQTVVKLKNKAHEVIAEEKIMLWSSRRVNTAAAYKAWGLDIADLERRYKKLTALNKSQQTRISR